MTLESILALVPTPATFEIAPGAAPFALDAGDRDGAIEFALDVIDEVLVTEGALGDEGYRLSVDAYVMRAEAQTEAGLFYARQSLTQLVSRGAGGWHVPALSITDAPRFAYRGVMLDVARHFFDVETVFAYIDRAASLKFNALHLHLSDDQGWRIEITSRPGLTDGAGGFYSQEDYREIVSYAASRHMIVVPEIDVPSHTHAVSLAYPELCEPVVLNDDHRAQAVELGQDLPVAGEPYAGWAVGFSSLKIHNEATYAFLADVFGELAALTPGPYLHLGGDEAFGTTAPDFALFMARASEIVRATGKTPISWHEAGAAPGLATGSIGQYWNYTTPEDGHGEHALAFIRGGGSLILSPADAAYLDMKHDASTPLGLTWANGPTSVEHAYSWDAAAVIDGVDDGDILGVEAPLWTETIATLADIDTMAFPRIAAIAELAWSPAAAELRTWASFRQRVGALGPLWASQGIGFFASPEIQWAHE